jgi:hypothetical protein
LVLTKPETTLIDYQYRRMLEKIQKLHEKTPRSFVHLLAGTIPGEALLHQKQLSLFMMVCHLPGNPVNVHARNILLTAPKSAKSWFQQVRLLCLKYGLDHPLHLLDHPPPKADFKALVKKRVTEYWEAILREEAANLPSLQYFAADVCSLSSPHPIWTASGSNSFECRKSEILVRMVSGRFRSEYLCRHWSDNRLGHCQADTCVGVAGDLEHLLVHCPALAQDRKRLWEMFFIKSVQFPALFHFLQDIEKSGPTIRLKFLLDPLAFSEILNLWSLFGQNLIDHIYYLIRTYAYYLHRRKQILIGNWSSDHIIYKRGTNRGCKYVTKTPGADKSDINNNCRPDPQVPKS